MQQRIDTKARTARYAFNSLRELGQWIDATPRTWRTLQSKRNAPEKSWDLNLGYAGALKLASDGWIEGAQRAQKALREFQPAQPAPAMVTDFYGHMPHVPRFCAGAPDSMIRHANPPRFGEGKVLTLYVPLSASCATNAVYMANYGLGVAQYVNQLESEGTRCEVWGCLTQLDGWRVTFAFKVKSAEQPLDLAVMAFAIGHPAIFRRIGFALLERCASPTMDGYGYPQNADKGDLIDPPHSAVILNGMKAANTTAKTPEQALEAITAEIEKAIELQWEQGT